MLTNARTHTCMHACTQLVHTYAVPSVITAHPQVVVDATEWTEVILTCSASGTPTPIIRWEREGGAPLPVGAVSSSPESMSGNTVDISYPHEVAILNLLFYGNEVIMHGVIIIESVDSISRDGPDTPYIYNTLQIPKYLKTGNFVKFQAKCQNQNLQQIIQLFLYLYYIIIVLLLL